MPSLTVVVFLSLGIGGSATNDGGIRDAGGYDFRTIAPLSDTGAGLHSLSRIKAECLARIKINTFRVTCDVTNPLCGPMGSVRFWPTKGATPEMVKELDEALLPLRRIIRKKPLTMPTASTPVRVQPEEWDLRPAYRRGS